MEINFEGKIYTIDDLDQLSESSDKILGNREFMLLAVKQDGEFLSYAAKSLQNDKELALAAVEQNGKAFGYVLGDLQNDRDIIEAYKKSIAKTITKCVHREKCVCRDNFMKIKKAIRAIALTLDLRISRMEGNITKQDDETLNEILTFVKDTVSSLENPNRQKRAKKEGRYSEEKCIYKVNTSLDKVLENEGIPAEKINMSDMLWENM